ncbi:uncharacterized protein EDB91DRAFT_1081832 [Suillus paluster]|uniref:uncharacterized protein n=1 Tax=Suillus paluster TaxID=48578 RepID=UPI001B860C79|nr:uncharacterized protein EDB91DRAFT_1081832 [Suillus paluster]KAG1741574.1 hypothetical protein EDB91DRAFT_1081832 [Suillus paluster]
MSRLETDILDSLSTELSQQLKNHVDQALLEFIRPNSASQFAQHAPELAHFRKAIAQSDSKDDNVFLRSFREFIPTTNYEPYRPFIAKFFATPCREADVKDMLAPGLPYFFSMSSMTSRAEAKTFPRYRPPPYLLEHRLYLVLPPSEGTTLSPSTLKYQQILKIECEDGRSSKKVTVCSLSVGFLRMAMNWDVENDKDRLDLWVPGQTDPFAISLVGSYRAYFVLNALFALADRRYVEDEWTLLVDCIEKGIIPDVEDLGHLRAPLEKHLTPNPLRAAELREIGPPGPQGWAVRVWPDLREFIGITGGPAAASVPKARQVLWFATQLTVSDTRSLTSSDLLSACSLLDYGGSECSVAVPYHKGNPNIDFKVLLGDGVTEFLNWELVTGGHYEPVLTTRNGLWRYRLGDVVAIKGFDPDDGLPIINYLHRREVAIDERGSFLLLNNVSAQSQTSLLWEIVGQIGKDAGMAIQQTFEHLIAANDEYCAAVWEAKSRKPTIRLVEKGTFSEYRRQRSDKTNVSIGQVKVPVVLSDPTFKEWLPQESCDGAVKESELDLLSTLSDNQTLVI